MELPTYTNQVPLQMYDITQSSYTPTKIYDQIVDQWMTNIGKYLKSSFPLYPLETLYFSQFFLPQVENKFQLKITYDVAVANCIASKLEKPQYQRFSMGESDLSVNTIQKGQKWIFLLKISEIIYRNKFIPKSKFYKILQICSPQNAVQTRLALYCQAIEATVEAQKSKKNRISLKQWNQITKIDCKHFWSERIFLWPPALVAKSKIVIKVFKIFEHFLTSNLDQQKILKLRKLLQVGEHQIVKKRSQYLQNLANQLDIFNTPAKIQAIQFHLSKLKQLITSKLVDASKGVQQIRYQIYGSFRSRLCLSNSDVDLAVLVHNNQNTVTTERQFMTKKLWKIYHLLNNELNKSQLQIQCIKPLIFDRVKVPFLKVYFKQLPISKLDIVVNNHQGVYNSQMIERFTQNITIRNLCLLIKKWAKKNQLISEKRLSSFGLTLMFLYFLMRSGFLQFINQQCLKSLNFSVELKIGKLTYIEILLNFFNFYSSKSEFYQRKDVVCLMKKCTLHSKIIDPQLIINMHDPFDGPSINPGRIKLYDKQLFFDSLENAKKMLHEAKLSNSEEQRKQLDLFFGIERPPVK